MKQAARLTAFLLLASPSSVTTRDSPSELGLSSRCSVRSGLVTIGNEGSKVNLVLWCAQRPVQLNERQAAVYLAP